MAGKVLLLLIWIPRPPHIWITRVLSSLDLAFLTDWERQVKMCLNRPQCGWQPMKFSHNEMYASRYVIVLGGGMVNLSTEKVQETPKERMRGKGKTSIDVGGEEDTLTFAWLGLGFPLR